MSLGFTVLGTARKQDPAGAPFAAGAAADGCSVDPVTGQIIWGNAVAEPGQPAQLVQNHDLLLNAFLFFFTQGNIAQQNLSNRLAWFLEGSLVCLRASQTSFDAIFLDQFGDSNGIFVGFVNPP